MSKFNRRSTAVMVSLVTASVLLGACAARAQDAGKFRKVCKADVAAHCKDVEAGGGRIIQCLASHSAELAPDCKSAVDSMIAKAKERAKDK